ncbi:Subtilisin-like serine protease PR1C [Tolypocladium paradoxum]|uniref:Subtilisin-like serine protease PR1C n=1 Tax=Tolypocladium paradoxum TaxID=94208 RepID=A0A2S4KUU7_9HYPO|nr:Subtilisin-like serine protease PR1C [Tolypocladium paradoxum]
MVRSSVFLSLLGAAPSAQRYIPGAYMFEFEDGHDSSTLLGALGGNGTARMHLDYKLFKGVSVQIHDVENPGEKVQSLAALPAVKNMWHVGLYGIPDVKVSAVITPNPNFRDIEARANKTADEPFATHVMTQVDKLRAKGITGKGVKIAVIDSGIDYTHPALGGCFGEGCLVSFGMDLVGDNYDGLNTPQPDNDPRDCEGHGSHVAGIIAAQPNRYGFTGAAPGVTLSSYRVLGCEGGTSDDVLVAAFNKALEDGASIISAAIGSAAGWTEQPWAVAVTRIVEQGVPCVLAAGNDGDQGLFYSASAADAKKATAVASFDNVITPNLLYVSRYSVDGGDEQNFAYAPATQNQWDVTMPVYATSPNTTIIGDACDPLPDNTPDLNKSIVLIRRGGCLFVTKASNAVAKGAKYIMIYNHLAGAFSPI